VQYSAEAVLDKIAIELSTIVFNKPFIEILLSI
jgi:hypothetical protein